MRSIIIHILLGACCSLPAAGPCVEPPPAAMEMLQVTTGTFTMGRLDYESNFDNSLPRHEVMLDQYAIGKYEVKGSQFVEALNWAYQQGLLRNATGEPWENGDLYIEEGDLQPIVEYDSSQRPVVFTGSEFVPAVHSTDDGGVESLADYPAYMVSWYGALAFCNWLSTMEGYAPAYNLSVWSLIDADPSAEGLQFTNGYRLPTEAEWERAAGWSGSEHYVYATGTSVSNIVPSAANYFRNNPMGFSEQPHITPGGYYNGVNLISAYGTPTYYSASPVGAFDMSGNVYEWCHDWYGGEYYAESPDANPLGPDTGYARVARGGSWNVPGTLTRSASRFWQQPEFLFAYLGFRVARSHASFPNAPGTPAANVVSANEIKWSWSDNSSDELGFNVYVGTGFAPRALPLFLVEDSTTLSLDGLQPNTRYAIQVSALGTEGEGARTKAVSVTTPAVIPVAPVAGGVTTNSLTLSIGPGDGNPTFTQYAIYSDTTNQWVQADGTLADDLFWNNGSPWGWGTITLHGLNSATLYSFRSRARSLDGIETEDGPAVLVGTNAVLEYIAGPNGALEGELYQEVSYASDGAIITAVPDSGYSFVRWSDGSTENPRQDMDVTADVSVTAVFDGGQAQSVWMIQ